MSITPLPTHLISVPAMQWQSTYWVPPYFIIKIIFLQISALNNCRTVCTTPAIYTSKRAARPGSVCYYFFCRYALRWRRDSQKTTSKNPIDFQWGKTEKYLNFAAIFLGHTFAEERLRNFRADTRLSTFSLFKPYSISYYAFAAVAADSLHVLPYFWRERLS